MFYKGQYRDTIEDVLGSSLALCLPPDQSDAWAEIAASAAWWSTQIKTTSASSSQFHHPTDFAWRKS